MTVDEKCDIINAYYEDEEFWNIYDITADNVISMLDTMEKKLGIKSYNSLKLLTETSKYID